jgi:heme ABC exporter ATP-binding subunit CcmA
MAALPEGLGVKPAVEIAQVSKYFGDFPALRDIEFLIEPGSVTALLGRNGAGKTTLLRILAGLSKPTRGAVKIHGENIREEATRRKIGVLGHGLSLYEELSARENLLFFARLYGLDDPEHRTTDWLDRVGLARVRDGLVREFSRGMRQRLAIARTMMHQPDVILLDEPFTSLDDKAIALLQSLIRDEGARGATILMSTHQVREAMELASHVLLLNKGRVAYAGARPTEMLDDPGWLYRTFEGEAN